jgi:hypothetical protein
MALEMSMLISLFVRPRGLNYFGLGDGLMKVLKSKKSRRFVYFGHQVQMKRNTYSDVTGSPS